MIKDQEVPEDQDNNVRLINSFEKDLSLTKVFFVLFNKIMRKKILQTSSKD